MATIKSFTDISQSKVLAKILPIESADMYYQYVLPKSSKIKHIPAVGNPINALEWYNKGYTFGGKEPITLDEYCVPCWSLAVLISVLPQFIEFKGDKYYLRFMKEYVEYANDEISITGRYLHTTGNDNLVDACYEMILKLHELNLL